MKGVCSVNDEALTRHELSSSTSEVERWMGGYVSLAKPHSVTSIIPYCHDGLTRHVLSAVLSATFY